MAMLSFGIFSTASAYGAVCSFDPSNSTGTITYTIPANLNVPRDAANGTVIWKSEPKAIPGKHSWTCTAAFKYGMTNSVGVSASSTAKNWLPIGDTGLAWSWEGYFDILYGPEMPAGKGYFFSDPNAIISLIKIGPVKAGASVPVGILGYMNVNNEINIFTIKTSNKSSVATLSCKTPDVIVKMGDQNYVGSFKGVGTSLAPVNFSIALKECPEGINKVSYQLNPNTPIVDATRSVVALDAESTAKGVGLQLLDSLGNPVALKTKLQYSDYDKLGGNFNIPLKAAYHQTGSAIVPGTANSSVTFVMSYD
ncbi:fimbrial protein [Ralstonia mannitolilytica]|nr:fimbrial protein [Ralstonia mannitolilytica]